MPFDSLLGRFTPFVSGLLSVSALLSTAATAQVGVDLGKLALRRLGPAAMGGRVVGLAVQEDKPSTFYVATASGGLWKTVNNGTTFAALFQHEKVVSIGAVAMAPSDPETIWVGTGEANNRNSTSWGRGVYKSTDGGKTWSFKGLPKSFHVGRIAIHPQDADRVFVAAVGDLWAPNEERGLYRTTDGGESWKLVLSLDPKTGATEVRIDPSRPDTVYAALYERQRDGFDGNHPKKRWGPGSGLYRSDDGGDTWKELTAGLPTCEIGRISLDIYRKDPRVVWALVESEKIGARPVGAPAARPGTGQGNAYLGFERGDEGAGGVLMGRVVDDGPAAKAGLETGDLVIEFADEPTADYDGLVAILGEKNSGDKVRVSFLRDGKKQSVEVTLGERPAGRGFGGRGRRGLPFADRIGGQVANRMRQQGANGFETGGIYRSADRGETWERVNSLNPRPYYFSQIRVDPSDEKYVYVCGISVHMSSDRGKTFGGNAASTVHVDHHALWVDPKDGRHLILGCDGGVNVSYDRSKTWETWDNMDIGQAYHAVADTRRPYWVYAGYQDNGSWGSPSETPFTDGIANSEAFKVGSGDGFVCRVDPEDPDVVFYESQGGNIGWTNVMTRQGGRVRRATGGGRRGSVRPQGTARPTEATAERGATQGTSGAAARGGQRGGQRGRPSGRQRASARPRSNWDTPFFLSPFNSKTLYFAGDRVYKSINRGRQSKAISPKIGLTDEGTATELVESPRSQGLLWVGTDDGSLRMTRDDGRNWTDLTENIRVHLPDERPLWVSSISLSRYESSRCYIALDGHRVGDKAAYVFVSEDNGKTFESIAKGLPGESVHVVLEDSKNPDLLYVGNEMGLYLSFDRGKRWQRLGKPFPTVAVRDLDIQEREQHLILATHGRSVWALDIRPLRELTAANRKKDSHLVSVADVLRLPRRSRSKQGHRHFALANPPQRAEIYYWLGEGVEGPVTVEVTDVLGKVLFEKKIEKPEPGLGRVDWNLTRARRGVAGAIGRAVARFGGRRGRGRVPVGAGTFAAKLRVADGSSAVTFAIEDDERPLDVSWPRPPSVGEGGSLLEQQELDDGEEGDEEKGGRIR